MPVNKLTIALLAFLAGFFFAILAALDVTLGSVNELAAAAASIAAGFVIERLP
jgi:hypothetical protein